MKKILSSIFVISLIFSFVIPATTEAASKKIGEFCSSNSECLSGDCEDNVCDCDDQGESTSNDCAVGLQTGSAADWRCIDEDKDPQSRGNDFCVKSSYPGGTYPDESTSNVIYPISHKLNIGEKCENNDQCKTGNCEDSNLDGEYDNFCVCSNATQCQQYYGGETSQWECRGHNIGSADDINGLNYCYNTKTGQANTAVKTSVDNLEVTDAVLRPIGTGEAFQSDIANLIQKPNPTINIPGLNFSDVDLSKMTVTDALGNRWLKIPFLGEYISAIYKYGIVVIAVIAVFGIIIGGVTLIGSGGNTELVSSAKKRIMMSVIAIIIATTSYTLLYIINPDLVNFRNLKVLTIQQNNYDDEFVHGIATGDDNTISVDSYVPPTQQNQTASVPTQTQQNTNTTGQLRYKSTSGWNQYLVDCSSFENTAKGRIECRKACLEQLSSSERSTLAIANPQYDDKYLGFLDCSVPKTRNLSQITTIVLHEGSGKGALDSWWRRFIVGYTEIDEKNNTKIERHPPIGSHYFITREGLIMQIVDEKFVIWHGYKNDESIGVDLDAGCSTNKSSAAVSKTCSYTQKQYDALNRLIKDINTRIKKTAKIYGHCENKDTTHMDPRNFDWSKIGLNNADHRGAHCTYAL